MDRISLKENRSENIKMYEAYRNALAVYEDNNLTIVRYDLITRKVLNSLNKEDALVIISISPMEVHGNFLPLGTDFIEAIMMNEIMKNLLKERKNTRQYTIIEVPPLPIGTGALRGVKGTVHISHATFRNIVREYIEGFVNAGFTKILISSAHHGLIHALAIEEAAKKIMKKYKNKDIRIVSPLNWIVKKIYVDNPKRTWTSVVKELGQPPLTEEEFQALFEDHHSSIMEISFVKHINPALVDPEYKKCVPHVEGNLHGIKALISSKWANLGGREGCAYNGHPAMADNRDWFMLYETLVKEVAEEFIDALFDKNPVEFKSYTKSFMWPIFFLKTNYKYRFFISLIICLAILFYLPLFPWTLIPICLFGIYFLVRVFLILQNLKKK